MTASTGSPGRAELRLTATLDTPDDRNAISNEIHSTDGAKDYGYQAALVGGATVFGWATPAILQALGEGWTARGWAEVAFRRPTYPGEDLVITVAPAAERDAWDLHITGPDGHDRVSGSVGLGDAAWLDQLDPPPLRAADQPLEEIPHLTMEVAPVGQEIRALGGVFTEEDARIYARERGRATEPMFLGERPLLHPGWVAMRPIRVLHHSFNYGPAIHAKSQIQFLRPAHAGGELVTTSKFIEAYERKGHHYAVIDCSTFDAAGGEVVRQRHVNIFGVAKRPAAGQEQGQS
ncbi:MAG: hypothetical protein M0R73_09475 [Dehalococcoidia bacterium]|nr:hypothetical protein [Dehalococcoidia bacterium]